MARSVHSTPSLPWGRWSLILWLQQPSAAESRAEGAACDPRLKQQGWRKALLIPFPPESSSCSSPSASPGLQEHKPRCKLGWAPTDQLLLGSGSRQSHCSGSCWNSEPESGSVELWSLHGQRMFIYKSCQLSLTEQERQRGWREEQHSTDIFPLCSSTDAVGGG